MNYVGCDFHTRFQQISMLNTQTGEAVERRLYHQGKEVEGFYASLPDPTVVGIESTGYTIWFHELMEDMGIELRVGDAAKIRAQQVHKKKNDREDARLICRLLAEDRFPELWMIDAQGRDLRLLLTRRQQWVRMRTAVKNALHSLALNHRLALGSSLFTRAGKEAFRKLKLRPLATQRWVRITGRDVSWSENPWLEGPVGDVDVIGSDFFSRYVSRRSWSLVECGTPRGLLKTFSDLAGPTCNAAGQIIEAPQTTTL